MTSQTNGDVFSRARGLHSTFMRPNEYHCVVAIGDGITTVTLFARQRVLLEHWIVPQSLPSASKACHSQIEILFTAAEELLWWLTTTDFPITFIPPLTQQSNHYAARETHSLKLFFNQWSISVWNVHQLQQNSNKSNKNTFLLTEVNYYKKE